MAEIVNLRVARKRKARDNQEAQAAANRVRFGRTKAQKQRETAMRDTARRGLDAHAREGGDDA